MTFGEGIFVVICCFGVFGMYSCAKEMDTPEYKAEQKARIERCLVPVLVAEKDGVQLYAIDYPERDCPGRPVYFSKSGTHTTHTEHHGKSTSTYDDDVAGGQ